jgi:hypothetical protein
LPESSLPAISPLFSKPAYIVTKLSPKPGNPYKSALNGSSVLANGSEASAAATVPLVERDAETSSILSENPAAAAAVAVSSIEHSSKSNNPVAASSSESSGEAPLIAPIDESNESTSSDLSNSENTAVAAASASESAVSGSDEESTVERADAASSSSESAAMPDTKKPPKKLSQRNKAKLPTIKKVVSTLQDAFKRRNYGKLTRNELEKNIKQLRLFKKQDRAIAANTYKKYRNAKLVKGGSRRKTMKK